MTEEKLITVMTTMSSGAILRSYIVAKYAECGHCGRTPTADEIQNAVEVFVSDDHFIEHCPVCSHRRMIDHLYIECAGIHRPYYACHPKFVTEEDFVRITIYGQDLIPDLDVHKDCLHMIAPPICQLPGRGRTYCNLYVDQGAPGVSMEILGDHGFEQIARGHRSHLHCVCKMLLGLPEVYQERMRNAGVLELEEKAT